MSVLVKAKFYDTNFQKVETVYVGVYIDVYMDFPVVLVLKNVPANAGDVRNACWITGLGRCLEEDMATHSSILAWKIQWTEEPGRLQSIGLQKFGHDRNDLAHVCKYVYI